MSEADDAAPAVRALSWSGFQDLVRDIPTQYPEDGRIVIGTHTPRRDWPELLREMLGIQGIPFEQDVDAFVDALNEDDLMPSHVHEAPTPTADDGGWFVGDFAYPAHGFQGDDPSVLEAADTQLLGTHLFPADSVATSHHRVLSVDEYANHVMRLADHYGDERAVLVGRWMPQDTYQIFGHEGDYQVAGTRFPPTVFEQEGFAALKNAHQALAGTIIVPRDILTPEVQALVDGERDEVAPPAGGVGDD